MRCKRLIYETVQRAEDLIAQCGYEGIGIAVSNGLLRYMVSEADIYRHFELTGMGQIKLCGFDVYPVYDEGYMSFAATPIITSERYSADIRYKGGELIVRDGKVYRVSTIDDPLGFGLIETEFRFDAERRQIVKDIGRYQPPKSRTQLFNKKPVSDEFEPTPELDQLLVDMTRRSE